MMQAGVKGAMEARFQVASLHCQLSDSSAASCAHAESGTTLHTSHLCSFEQLSPLSFILNEGLPSLESIAPLISTALHPLAAPIPSCKLRLS